MSDEHNMRAAEYVLGALDADERAAFQRQIEADPAARAAAAEWEKKLAPLATLTPPVAPPAELWTRIERALPAVAAASENVGGGVADNVVALRRSARNWRRAALATGALAAGLALFIADQEMTGPKPAGVFVAAVNRGGDRTALIVRVDLATRTVYVRPVSAETPQGKSLELWMIPPGEKPRSMGVIGAESERLPAPTGVAIEQATFAVTIEPTGGSPTGGPTGPVVYSGALVKE